MDGDMLADLCTPLSLAAYGNHPDCVAFLIGRGAARVGVCSSVSVSVVTCT